MHSRILILDFGSQVTQLIARRVREAGVFTAKSFPYDVGTDFIHDYAADGSLKGIILSGGPNSAHRRRHAACAARSCSSWRLPVLGICYGMQTMAEQLGGKVESGKLSVNSATPRFETTRPHTTGSTDIADAVTDTDGKSLLEGLDEPRRQSHCDAVPASNSCARLNEACPIAGMADEET